MVSILVKLRMFCKKNGLTRKIHLNIGSFKIKLRFTKSVSQIITLDIYYIIYVYIFSLQKQLSI